MDTDPNAYVDRGSSFGQSRPPTGHRTGSSSQAQDALVEHPRDPRSATHPSPKIGNSSGCTPQCPPSPKLAPSPSLTQTPTCTPHAESSAHAAARHAAVTQLEPPLFTPFVSPAPAPQTQTRGPTATPSSADQLQQMLRSEEAQASAKQVDATSVQTPAPSSPPAEAREEPELLTCKPLDRVASQMSTSTDPSPVPQVAPQHDVDAEWARHARQKPMERIVSQAGHYPYAPPPHHPHHHYHAIALKRSRSMSDPPETYRTQSVQVARTAAKYFRGVPRKKMRMWSAKDAAEYAEGDRIMRQIRGRAQDHFAAAAREPPVNMRSLRVLDTSEVLRLPQMRHDLLFDNFGFRPILHSPIPSPVHHSHYRDYSSTNYGLQSTLRSQIVHPSPASEAANRYWDCIRAEVEYGCRCTRWDGSGMTARVKECICGCWKHGLSEQQWWKESRATWPSRLPKLIQTLREILESLMASTTPCVNSHSSREPLPGGGSSVGPGCPTVTHSLVPALFAALDPEFLTVQVRRGNFDTEIFRVIGEAMKVHCAPVRDSMVDDMVRTATGSDGCAPDVVLALRKCFDCVEVMKLDIANHQVQSLKGMLWQQAEQNEMTTFINYLIAAQRTLETSKTHAWIHAASKRVALATAPRERRHIMGQCACSGNTEFVIRSLADGFIELVFSDWVENDEMWPPIVPSRRPGTPVTHSHVFPSKVMVPEVFKMDSARLKNFHAEMVDIAIARSILLTFKERYVAHNPKATAEEVAEQVAQVRESYKHVMTLGNGFTRASPDCPSDLSLHMAHRIIFSHLVYGEQPRPQTEVAAVNNLARKFDRLMAQHIVLRDSPAYADSLAALRKLAHMMLTNTLLLHRVQPESFLYDMRGIDSKPCTRGEPIPTAPRLRLPARRFVTLTEPLTGQGPSTMDPREQYHRGALPQSVLDARDLFNKTLEASQAREAELASELGFDALVHEIRAVVDRMVKTADFNLCVFANLYGRQGMLLGSGVLQPLPELSPGAHIQP